MTRVVLIVEDDPLVAEVITDIISSLGYSVICAPNGAEAVERFRELHGDVFCILLDFELPGMHSSRALCELREINSRVKVLLSSGYPASEILKDFPFEDVDGFIPKPYDMQLLRDEFQRLS